MKKTVLVLSAAMALSVMTVSTGWAQGDPSCAEAQLSFIQAQKTFDDAVAADKAAADAKAADEALARAERALEDAREAALSGGVPVESQTAGDAQRLREELASLEDIPVGDRSPDQQGRIDTIKERLPLIDAVVSAQARLVSARAAASADADRLADVAAKTDAEALLEVRNEARKAADEACGGVTTTPPTPTAEFPVDLDCSDLSDQEAQKVLESDLSDPHNLDYDEDGLACEEADNVDSVAIPVGGVNTGGGPA